jgi:RHS repeat-associated protein
MHDIDADVVLDGSIGLSDLLFHNSEIGSTHTDLASGLGNIVGYAGYLYDEASGMYHVRHRWYSPEKGRWASRDPLLYADGQAMYGYVGASPLTFFDPFGLARVVPNPTDGMPHFVPEGDLDPGPERWPPPYDPSVPTEVDVEVWTSPAAGSTLHRGLWRHAYLVFSSEDFESYFCRAGPKGSKSIYRPGLPVKTVPLLYARWGAYRRNTIDWNNIRDTDNPHINHHVYRITISENELRRRLRNLVNDVNNCECAYGAFRQNSNSFIYHALVEFGLDPDETGLDGNITPAWGPIRDMPRKEPSEIRPLPAGAPIR